MLPTPDQIARAPKVVLHDHLDGGLRPQTVIELAHAVGHELPTTDVDELEAWFTAGANRRNLDLYLETFSHTVAVMQTEDALIRVAREFAEDLAADGVVYAEVRFAPELHIERGLELDPIVDAVVEGFRQGADGRGVVIGTLLTAMRTAAHSTEIAELAVRHRDHGVVGFDIAGREKGFPPTLHLDAFEYVRRENFHITIHAGEAFGLPSIWEALQHCGAERLGHGIRIVDDIEVHDDGNVTLGRLAQFVRDRRIPLEVCPTSNVHTGIADRIADHPIDLLKRLRFRVTLNTDNRLMSHCTMTSEMTALVDSFGYDLADLEWLTLNGMKSAFWPFDDRLYLINSVIKPKYAALRAEIVTGPAGARRS
jgi:adenosine deaminase